MASRTGPAVIADPDRVVPGQREPQHVERRGDGLLTDHGPVADEPRLPAYRTGRCVQRDEHRADGLGVGTTVRPGDPGDADADLRRATLADTGRQRERDGLDSPHRARR